MSRTLMSTVLVALSVVGAAYGDTLTLNKDTPNYASLFRDGYIRGGVSGDGADNLNWGGSQGDVRLYPDGAVPSGKSPRHNLIWFDLSTIPAGSTINSAIFGIYFKNGGPTITNYALSRVKPGNDWTEGIHTGNGVDPGEVTWNNRHFGGAAWQTPGATGANDIDQATTIYYNKTGSVNEYVLVDIKSFVQGWVSGDYENNGLLMWGGSASSTSSYWQLVTKEETTNANRPYLIVSYTVEGTCRTEVTPSGPQSVTGYAGGLSAPFASVDLGSSDVGDGLTHPSTGDGDTLPAAVAGRVCQTNADPADDFYMYFAVDDSLAFQGSRPAVTISFDYFDEGSGAFALDYDSNTGDDLAAKYKNGGSVSLTGTNTWKRGSFTVTDALFSNRENYGADFRIAGPAGHFYLDTVSVAVTGNHGPEITYTIDNAGSTATTWAAIEANADGTANDYAWLSLTPDPATGPLAIAGSASVKATIDTSSLGHGPQTAYLKFTDGCAAPATYTEPFTYSNGALAGQGGWVGTGETGPIVIETNQVNLNGSGASASAHTASHAVTGFEGVFSVKVNVKTGGALAGREANNFWAFRAYDASGEDFGYWVGSPTTVKARNPLDANQASAAQTVGAAYKTMEMRINSGTRTAQYYYDGALVATYPFAAVGGLGGITLERIANVGEVSASEYVYLDDAQVTSVQQYKIRQINLDVIGCDYAVEPRTTTASGFGGTVQQSFAVINTGAYNITGLTVTEIDRNSPYGNLDYPWLQLTVPSSINLAPGESAEVVATVDLDQVASPEPPASLKCVATFASACAGVSGEDKLIDAVTPLKLESLLYNYEMDVSVDDALNLPAGTPAMTEVALEGYTGYGRPEDGAGYDLAGQGNDCVKSARFVDTPLLQNNHAFYLRGLGAPAGVSGFTVDMRVWGEEMVTGQRSMGICNNLWQGRGVRIEPTSVDSTDDSLRITFDGNGVVAGPWIIPDNPNNASRFHMIRFVVYNDTKKIELYDLENDLDPGPGVNWNLVGTVTNMGDTNGVPGAREDGGGICLNTNSGSGTTNSKWSADWVRIIPNVALAPTDDIIGGANGPCGLFADVDGDGDVDQADFAVFQLCFTGPKFEPPAWPELPANCRKLDYADDDNSPLTPPAADGDIDSFDLAAFEKCASGPGVPADVCCDGQPKPGCP
jgi:hypothetical protein